MDYIYPAFGLLLVVAAYLFCIRMPYHALATASGSFRQTQIASYGESIINIILSVTLVLKYGLIGVVIGTVAAVLFRFPYYVFFLSRHVMRRGAKKFVLRSVGNVVSFVTVAITGSMIISIINITGFMKWGLASVVVTAVSCAVWISVDWVVRGFKN